MTARQSKWDAYAPSLPSHATPYPHDRARDNMRALWMQMVVRSADKASAVSHGWDYTNSNTLGEAGGGTATQPTRKYWKHVPHKAPANQTWILKADMTYTGANPTKIAFYFSEDNGATYAPMVDDDGHYVVTISYSGGDITSTTWGNVP